LYDHLFGDKGDYNKYVRPVLANDTAVNVQFSVRPIDFLGFNEFIGYGVFTVWEKMQWTDNRLVWNPNDFAGVADMRVPIDHLWTPDIMLYKSDLSRDVEVKPLALLYSSGSLLYVNPAQRSVPCYKNETKGSVVLTCNFKYGSWTYDGFKVNTTLFDHDDYTSEFSTSLPYELIEVDAVYEAWYYPCCPEPYPAVTFRMLLKETNGDNPKKD
jgi:hypothetical protein